LGHAYTADGLLEEKSEALEGALYLAPNTLNDSATVSERLAVRLRGHSHGRAAARYEERAREARKRAADHRRVLTEG
jgi:hypothetical protein